MSNWLDLVTEKDKEYYPRLYGEYLDNLPRDIDVTYISGSNPGYYGLSESSRVDLKKPSGEKAVLVLSMDNQACIQCSPSMNDDSRRKWKELEIQLSKNVSAEKTKLFKSASAGICSSGGNKNQHGCAFFHKSRGSLSPFAICMTCMLKISVAVQAV